ncbi:MAG: RNA polymerase-binding protein RbpA [Nocardioidaceae bacterium]|jgi:rubredoxin|nr:RNA polymerase-binding protein RbpA [Nocardioidaceae bacterium]MDQ3324517.1 RNA polymerase-binding protein RbpA [Actinomycetota bacterium]MDQ3416980.1 RNA polymerase-binding protein RbpA [Actinomycetota bacterium]
MSDRALRGTRLGTQSFEDERGVEMAPRTQIAYDCTQGHEFSLVFAHDADVPSLWECPRCGAEGTRRDGGAIEDKLAKPVRTHWDMLRERRSIPELEDILTERLELLRAGEIGPVHLHRSRRTTKRSA